MKAAGHAVLKIHPVRMMLMRAIQKNCPVVTTRYRYRWVVVLVLGMRKDLEVVSLC
jgi:hypothetical protein